MEPFKIPWQLKVEKASDFLPVLWRFGQSLTDVEFRFKGGGKRKANGAPVEPLLAHSLALMGLNRRFHEQLAPVLDLKISQTPSSKRSSPSSSSSPYAHHVISLENGVSRDAFKFFLEYIYFVKSGEDISASVASGLLELSRDYECRRLSRDLEDFFIRTLDQNNLPEHFEIGRRFDFHQLVLKCLNMVAHSKPLFEDPRLWRRIGKELMNDVLAMDQLPVEEEALFEFFLSWCSEVPLPDALSAVRSSLKHHLRFPTMTLDFLATRVDSSGLLTKEELLDVAFDAACSPSVPRRSLFPSRKRKLVDVLTATSSKMGRYSVAKDEGMKVRDLKARFAEVMALPQDNILVEFDMKDGAFRRMCNAGLVQSQINMDDIEVELLDEASLKIVVMTTFYVCPESDSSDGNRLTLRMHPGATVGHLQTKVSHQLPPTFQAVPPSSIIFLSPDGNELHNVDAKLESVNIKDNDLVKYRILKIKSEAISLNVTDMTGDTAAFKMKRCTPLKKLKCAYAEKFHIREDEKQYCRFLYDGNRINDDDTPNTTGMDDGDSIEFFWAHDFDFGTRKKAAAAASADSLGGSAREHELE